MHQRTRMHSLANGIRAPLQHNFGREIQFSSVAHRQPKGTTHRGLQIPVLTDAETSFLDSRKIHFRCGNSKVRAAASRQREGRQRRAPDHFSEIGDCEVAQSAQATPTRPTRLGRPGTLPKPPNGGADQPLSEKGKQRDVSDWTEKVDPRGFD